MLALTRKTGQSIIIDDNIEITVVEVKGDQVRVGISAPRSVKILRKEIFEEIRAENKVAAGVSQIPGITWRFWYRTYREAKLSKTTDNDNKWQ